PSLGPPSPEPLPPVTKLEPIFGKGGIISFAVNGERVIGGPDKEESPVKSIKGENDEERIVMLSGGGVMLYTPTKNKPGVEITATRAVVFLKKDTDVTGNLSFDAGSIKKIYLESDIVAISGNYTLRGPRIYYDVENQEAVMPKAVF